jgi:hypothetical protein
MSYTNYADDTDRLQAIASHLAWIRRCIDEDMAAQARLADDGNTYSRAYLNGMNDVRQRLSLFDAVLGAPTGNE